MLVGTCLKALTVLLSAYLALGASKDIKEKVLHHEDNYEIKCDFIGTSGISYSYNKTDSSLNDSCSVFLKNTGKVTTGRDCPFDGKNFTGNRQKELLKIRVDAALHGGYWSCGKLGSPKTYIKSYAFRYIDHRIKIKEIGNDVHLECSLDDFYPSICENESPQGGSLNGTHCMNSEDNHLKWFKNTRYGLEEINPFTFGSKNDSTIYKGFYRAKNTILLPDTTIRKLQSEGFAYRCVFENFLGNKSTIFYPRPTEKKIVLHGDEIELRCPRFNEKKMVLSYQAIDRPDQICQITIPESDIELHQCPFTTKNIEGREGYLKIRKFDAPKHSGYWVCTSNEPTPIYHVIGYVMPEERPYTEVKEVGEEIRLVCSIREIYPTICNKPTGIGPCRNRADNYLRWFRKSLMDNTQSYVNEDLQTIEVEEQDGLYSFINTLTLKNTNLSALNSQKDYGYVCKFSNVVKNESWDVQPQRSVFFKYLEEFDFGVVITAIVSAALVIGTTIVATLYLKLSSPKRQQSPS